MATKVDYHRYLASREWREKRKEVIKGNDGLCYRCLSAPIKDVHHVTYERIGHEGPDDLIGLCRPCHEYLAAERDDDPAAAVIIPLILEGLELETPDHFGLQSAWLTKPLSNGRYFLVDFETSPEPQDYLPWTVVIPLRRGIWLHCYWL